MAKNKLFRSNEQTDEVLNNVKKGNHSSFIRNAIIEFWKKLTEKEKELWR